LSNNLKDHSYYIAMISDMEACANKEFFENAILLSVNIDLEISKEKVEKKLSEVRTVVEKKSKDTLFLKTVLLEDKKIIARASALWSKESSI